MTLSVGGMNGGSMISMQAQNYTVGNQSSVSSAYEESVKQMQGVGAGSSVESTSPVRYPNAQLVENKMAQVKEAQQMGRAYNDIAATFEGNPSSYGADRKGNSYALLGANIDVYA